MAVFKILLFLVRNPNIGAAAFRRHYEEVHLPLVRKTFPQMLDHRRNYPQEGGACFAPGLAPAYDAIAEVSFADRAGFESMLATAADPVAGAELQRDEEAFLHRAQCGLLVVDETIGWG